jgi:hypothetical protein
MSDIEAALLGIWSVVLGVAWVFVIFLPRGKRLRERYGWPPPEAPMAEQLGLIGWIVAGAVLITGIGAFLAAWEAIALFAIPPLLYAFLMAVLWKVERQVESAAAGRSRSL